MLIKLAFRNLLKNKRRTILTLLAVSMGMTVMIYSLTLRTGQYKQQIDSMVSQQAGHVVIQQKGYNDSLEIETVFSESSEILNKLQEKYPDATLTNRLFLAGLLSSTAGPAFGSVTGIKPDAEGELSEIANKVKVGSWVEKDKDIVIGKNMAETLNVDLGDKIVFSTQFKGEMSSQLFRVKGIFKTGADEIDSFIAYVHHESAQKLLDQGDISHQIGLHTADPTKVYELKDEIIDLLGKETLEILTWQEAQPHFVTMIETDKNINEMINFILMVIVYIGILNTILMSVMERTKELGVLLAIGMKPGRLARMVLCEGFLIGLFGSAFGLLLGVAVSYHLISSGLDLTASMGESMAIEGAVTSNVIKGAYNWQMMIFYVAMTVVFSIISASYPAWKITRMKPVEAMRQN